MVSNTNDNQKRARKKKIDVDNIQMIIEDTPLQASTLFDKLDEKIHSQVSSSDDAAVDLKKRGRKPKGGKLISKNSVSVQNTEPIVNVILHLKCSFKDLHNNFIQHQRLMDPFNYNSEIPPDIMTYNQDEQQQGFAMYETTENQPNSYAYSTSAHPAQTQCEYVCKLCNKENPDDEELKSNDDDLINMKNLNQKLKKLKIDLYKNTLSEKKSACFWCTYEFDNQPCYIPKYEMDGVLNGYGSFCRPECAVAYLM